MLKTRVLTAIVLLAVILPTLFFGSSLAINLLCALFFTAACWESMRLFGRPLVIQMTVVWALLFIYLADFVNSVDYLLSGIVGCLAWLILFIPALKLGLPGMQDRANGWWSTSYLVSILGCFLAILVFQRHSPMYLLSVMCIVWIADIGAYLFGKAFGRHQLAPTISPGKSWEGAIGGWLCVIVLGAVSVQMSAQKPFLLDTFSVNLFHHFGWLGLCLVLTILTAASVVGDLVESQLKRRAKVKDSSNLLPGHGGVLDRIDALILVLPVAILIEVAMNL